MREILEKPKQLFKHVLKKERHWDMKMK